MALLKFNYLLMSFLIKELKLKKPYFISLFFSRDYSPSSSLANDETELPLANDETEIPRNGRKPPNRSPRPPLALCSLSSGLLSPSHSSSLSFSSPSPRLFVGKSFFFFFLGFPLMYVLEKRNVAGMVATNIYRCASDWFSVRATNFGFISR